MRLSTKVRGVRESLLLDVYNREETWSAYITVEYTLRTRQGSFSRRTLPAILRTISNEAWRPPNLIINPFRRGALIFGPPSEIQKLRFGNSGVAELRQSRNFYRFDGWNGFGGVKSPKTIIFLRNLLRIKRGKPVKDPTFRYILKATNVLNFNRKLTTC